MENQLRKHRQNVVITGSTRGIGRGMAEVFLSRKCRVLISGRNAGTVDEAVRSLEGSYGKGSVFGHPCDVADPGQVEDVWSFAKSHFPSVDIWINNAGISQPWQRIWEMDVVNLRQTLLTNLTGAILGTRTALRGMIEQGSGKIFNMEGLGSDGRIIDRMSVYGTTKRGIRYFTRAVGREARNTGIIIGTLSPGMVLTDLLKAPVAYDREYFEEAKRVFNILADRVETVTPFLVDRILKARRNGARISWLSTPKVFLRFLFAPLKRRDLFSDEPEGTTGS